MLKTTIGQLLINNALPDELRDWNIKLDRKGSAKLLQTVAEKYPDKYREVAKALMDVGKDTAYETGSQSFSLRHMLPAKSALIMRQQLQMQIDAINHNSRLSDKQKEDEILKAVGKTSKPMEDAIMQESIAENNPFASQILSGARGNPTNLKSIRGGDGLYEDHRDRLIPIPILKSYSEGLSPAEYFAGSFGARKGVFDTKTAVADAGYFAKQMNQASHRLIVTANDADDPTILHDRGLPVDTDDQDSEGALLAKTIGPYKRDTVLTPKILNHIKELGHEKILIRSPITGGAPEGGLYAKDVGVRERGILAPLGEMVGLASAQSLCLAKGTLIRMADGSTKAVEDIAVDDEVLGADIASKTFPVKVKQVFDNGKKPCCLTRFKSESGKEIISLISTADHKILTESGLRPVGVKSEEFVVIAQNPNKFYRLSVDHAGVLPTYDIYVDHPDHLFVLANGLIVSNSEPLTQSQLCLSEITEIRMADWTTKLIKDINVDDEVLGADMTGKTFPVKVKKVFRNGKKPCCLTKFKIGISTETINLISTPDHKILTEAGLQPVGVKSKKFAAILPKEFTSDNLQTEPFALLLGLLLGDGCYTKSVHGCHLSCFDDILPVDIKGYLASLNLKMTLLAGQRGYYRISQIKEITTPQDENTGRFTGSYRNPALQMLQKLGMLHKYAYEKIIPDVTFTWNNDSVAALLSGLFVTDGSICVTTQSKQQLTSRPTICFGSTSETMVRQVKELLAWRFGIKSGKIDKNNSSRKRTLYSISITSTDAILRFAKYIPLYGIKKQTLTDCLSKWTIMRAQNHNKFYRLSADPVGELETFDIEVDHPDHLFVLANGLIVENSSKHAGGVAGAAKGVSGFKGIKQLTSIPKHFRSGAAHAQLDGKVDSITPAPAGGHYLFISGQQHYIPTGFDAKVKPGDSIEAGDVLSEGTPNPAEIVRHKGIGEGRRYFVKALRETYKDAGISAHRRNIEILSHGLINHVRFTDPYNEYLPDDVMPFNWVEHNYRPREGHQELNTERAKNMYLEKPVLHYTIGTHIKPSVIKELNSFGIKKVIAHPEPPPFQPEMIRSAGNLSHDPDWMTRMLGANLQRNLLISTHRGAVSNELGTSYVPIMARGIEFGRRGLVRDWETANKQFKDKIIP